MPEVRRAQADKELALIARKAYAPFFLTVHDAVVYARSQGILCQGRGSAANSIVCWALGITSMSPEVGTMVFERFVSDARDEPPDIDVDFEHERREEVIQYIYSRFGRERAGICATVIHYRGKRAIREVGAAMGLSRDTVAALSSQIWGWGGGGLPRERLVELGLDPDEPRLRLTMELVDEIVGFPRHLSQHVGGFVITEGRLDELVPIENAAMEDRTVICWDKDDIDTLGILKVDVLALGMLTCIRKALELLGKHRGVHHTLASLPPEDPAVYDMLCRADAIGVFQVESRAQLSFLPRMKPRAFYDLVIEVAIVRPGPIQGGMVHPYLRRRRGEEPIDYAEDHPLGAVLKRTLGVPLFQEQAMQIAIVGANFTPDEADRLRRALGDVQGRRHRLPVPRAVPRRHGGERLRRRLRRALLRPDRGVRQLRLPREPRGELRAAGLRLGLDQVPPSGDLRLRAPELAADGLLRAGADRARRARARGRGASRVHQPERLGQRASSQTAGSGSASGR